jgi:uncharacterized protein with NRDE domain
MCSIILRIDESGIFIAANRDELLRRPWQLPAAHWPEHPGIIAGRDETAGGTWLGLNQHGVMAAILNRHGTLGPAAGKTSRGELPLLALQHKTAEAAAAALAKIDAAAYRSFNLVIADNSSAYFLAGVESGSPSLQKLEPGTWMITSGEPNDASLPRIARHLPKFESSPFSEWPNLLADNTGPWTSALNIPPQNGFGTVSASLITLPQAGPLSWLFAPGPPDDATFTPIPVTARRMG